MYEPDWVVSIFVITGRNLITPFVSKSPNILILGFVGLPNEPDIIKLPESDVFPSNELLPIWTVEPVIVKDPVNVVFPTKLFEPLVFKLPVTVWSPMNMFEPVVANCDKWAPSNKSALYANDELKAYDEEIAFKT